MGEGSGRLHQTSSSYQSLTGCGGCAERVRLTFASWHKYPVVQRTEVKTTRAEFLHATFQIGVTLWANRNLAAGVGDETHRALPQMPIASVVFVSARLAGCLAWGGV